MSDAKQLATALKYQEDQGPQAGGNPLAKLYSYIDSMKRKGGDFLANPLDSMAQGIRNYGEDNSKILGLQDTAYLSNSVLNTPQERDRARQELAEYGSQVGLAGATVWQGSPHRFAPTAKNPLGEFDATKIGTGEGEQAYGHGHYLADDAKVARTYQKSPYRTLEGVEVNGKPANEIAQSYSDYTALNNAGRFDSVEDAIAKYTLEKNQGLEIGNKAYADGMQEMVESLSKFKGNKISKIDGPIDVNSGHKGQFYKVDLPDEHIARMLDWDKPLSQQSQGVRDAISNLMRERKYPQKKIDEVLSELNGQQSLNYLTSSGNKADASKALQQQGIPGIRYLDGGSRAGGAGTSNYVVFPGNEGMLKILERNGQTAAKPNNLVEALKYQQSTKLPGKVSENVPSRSEYATVTGNYGPQVTPKAEAQHLADLKKLSTMFGASTPGVGPTAWAKAMKLDSYGLLKATPSQKSFLHRLVNPDGTLKPRFGEGYVHQPGSSLPLDFPK